MGSSVAKRYTEDEQTRACLVLALNAGSLTRARKQLAGEGLAVSQSTLQRWRDTPRYLEIREGAAREIEETLVDDYREVAKRSIELQLKATEQALEEAEAKKLKDPGKTAQNAAISGGVAVDKLLTLTGRPTEIVFHGDPREDIKALARELGLVASIEGTAEPLPAAEELPAV